MAIVAPGPLVGSISGDVGGVSFANPSGSTIVRKKRRPSPQRIIESEARSETMILSARQWKKLDTATQDAWRLSARLRPRTNRLGISAQISGFNLFVSYQAMRHSIIDPVSFLPPDGALNQVLSNWAVTSTITSGIILTFDDAIDPNDRNYILYLGNPMRSTIPKFNRDWKFKGNVPNSTLEQDLTNDWAKTWPVPVLGQVVAVRVIPTNIADQFPANPIDLLTITTA